MGWLLRLRNRRGALVAALLLTVWLTRVGHTEPQRPGVDETVFTIERPQPV